MAALKQLKTAYVSDNTMPRLFIHDYFDVIAHHEDKENGNFLKQICNNLAQLMKSNTKLPAQIIIILNNDILEDTAFSVTQLPHVISRLLSEIQRMIGQRIKQLPDRCLKPNEPTVHLLKFLPRASNSPNSNLFKSTRRKLNNLIPDITCRYGFGFINAYEINTTSALQFNSDGKKLSPSGVIQLWESISHTIHEIIEDRRRKCKPVTTQAETQTDDVRNLPTFHQLKKQEEEDLKRGSSIVPKRENENLNSRRRLPPPPPQKSPHKSSARYHESLDYNSYHYNRYHFNTNRKY